MAENAQTGLTVKPLFKWADLAVPLLFLAVLGALLIPLAPWMMDFCLVTNLTFSTLILLVTLFTVEPLQFSSFPSLLLIATVIRLSFNVAATRLILSPGSGGEEVSKAGFMIQKFGEMVGGNDAVVGIVVFLIIVVIQFIVITSGAQRVSEVAARFTLDAMPGKQMAIDADLNSGIINEQEARTRREKVAREANFYGAMDGASKFVRGDAIAAIIIVMINIIGGFVIGMLRGNMSWDQVLKTYTLLTIGDGLVTVIPAFIIAIATGILVTRSASQANLGDELGGQIFGSARPLGIVAMALAVLAIFFHGWASIPLLFASALSAFGYTFLSNNKKREDAKAAEDAAAKPVEKEPENVSKLLAVDPMELEIGYGLIPLVEEAQGGDLLDRITMIRRQAALDFGLVVPPIRIRDNMQLASEGYSFKIRGVEVAKGEMLAGHFLAINSTGRPDALPGTKTKEPTFGLPAIWIEPALKSQAERQGYTVVDPPSVIATHLTEIIRGHASELLSRQDVQKLIETVRGNNPAVVDELTPAMLNLGEIQKVLQNLLKERVSIRDLTTILETLADHARSTKDTDQLTEYVRQSLYRSITKAHLSSDNAIHAVTLDPRLEQTLIGAVHRGEGGVFLALEPRFAQKVITALSRQVEALSRQGYAPLILCSQAVRLHFKRLIEKLLPNLTVLSYNELDPKTEIQSSGTVSVGDENTAV